MSKLRFSDAINMAIDDSMSEDKSIVIFGEGVPDPKSIFGTTKNLNIKYPNRVFDTPLSENAMTGIALGLSNANLKPILVHQRVDFMLLSMDQIINNIAKWYFMFNENMPVSLIIRVIIGRGWGQGPQHYQSLHSMFASIPGLKVLMPSSPNSVYNMIRHGIHDKNPILIFEHRWLFDLVGNVNFQKKFNISKSKIVHRGDMLTIVSMSFLTAQSIEIIKKLNAVHNKFSIELIDLLSVRPLDIKTIINSVKKTRKLIVLDTGHSESSIASEIISQIVRKDHRILSCNPISLCLKGYPLPTSHHLSKDYYQSSEKILSSILSLVDINLSSEKLKQILKLISKKEQHDIPYKNFTGPF